jgi:indole-3-glycerol phosphate synthase/phosphoribosylanthranilate isomerase
VPESTILERIVSDRKRDMAMLGPSFGTRIPNRRIRPLVAFLEKPGAILEIKRASPSKGKIAADLDVADSVGAYVKAGARNISVLTEKNHFEGSLTDLVEASASRSDISFLRKDFILTEDEIEISFRAGADAVLLIARILDENELSRLASACRFFGMMPFVEIRDTEDLRKLRTVVASGNVVAGLNARDLSDFSIDPLIPAAYFSELPCPAVYESGIRSAGAAAYARKVGFKGILVGEAAARDSRQALAIVSGFHDAQPDATGAFWRAVAERCKKNPGKRPLVKICGLTRPDDALAASRLGADMLGFVFAESPRSATVEVVKTVSEQLDLVYGDTRKRPFLIGIITETKTPLAKSALGLAREGTLNAIQWHGSQSITALDSLDGLPFGRFSALRVGNGSDLANYDILRSGGEPRILADSRVEGIQGGSGRTVPEDLVRPLAERGGLWLAGGLGPANVGTAIKRYSPELIDASSGLEESPGRKDKALIELYFKEIEKNV